MYWSPRAFRPRSAMPAGHIAILLESFSTGGSERIAIRLANAWSAAGRRVTIFCGSAEGPVRGLTEEHVAVVAVGEQRSRRRLGQAIAKEVAAARPDIVFEPGNHHLPIAAAMIGALPDWRPAVIGKISNPLRRRRRTWLAQALFGARLRRRTARFDRLVAMSPALAEEAAAVLGRADIACVAEPCLDRGDPLQPQGARSGLLLCVGRLTAQKNFALALEAFALLSCYRRLVILGEGEDYDALRQRARTLGIADRVRFVGYVDDVRPWLGVADALLCTSRFEGYPAALVEAIAAGLPVVTTRCSPALPEILFDRSFGRVAVGSPFALAEAIEAVADADLRPDPQHVRTLVQRHAIDRAGAEWLALLDETVLRRSAADLAPLERALTEPERVAIGA